jgi:hypothetical protein
MSVESGGELLLVLCVCVCRAGQNVLPSLPCSNFCFQNRSKFDFDFSDRLQQNAFHVRFVLKAS